MIKLECVFLGQTVSLVIVVICLGLGGWGQVEISLKEELLNAPYFKSLAKNLNILKLQTNFNTNSKVSLEYK